MREKIQSLAIAKVFLVMYIVAAFFVFGACRWVSDADELRDGRSL